MSKFKNEDFVGDRNNLYYTVCVSEADIDGYILLRQKIEKGFIYRLDSEQLYELAPKQYTYGKIIFQEIDKPRKINHGEWFINSYGGIFVWGNNGPSVDKHIPLRPIKILP